jgi:hypothetical protein
MTHRETTEQRLARILSELCKNDLVRKDWEDVKRLLSVNLLSSLERHELQEIVFDRDFVRWLQFKAERERNRAQRNPERNWEPLWIFLAWLVSSCLGILPFLWRLVRVSVACVCRVCRKCSVFLAVTFCVIILFGWFSLAEFLLKYFGYVCRLLALDYSVFGEKPPGGNQTCGNHTVFDQSSCCSDVPRFDFHHYWDNTPAARQMVVKRAMEDLKPELTKLVNVWSDKYLREQEEQAKRFAKIEEELRANQESMAQQSRFWAGVMGVVGVYAAGNTLFGAGRRFYNSHGSGQGLRAAGTAARAAACANAALQRAGSLPNSGIAVPGMWELGRNVFAQTLSGLAAVGYFLG